MLKTELPIPPSKPAVSTAGSLPYGMSQHRPSWLSQKTVITLHSSSFSHSSYPAIHESLPADLPLQYHSGLFISPSLKFYSSLCHDCLMSVSGWPPSFSIPLPPIPPTPVHCLHCSQGGLSSIQICLLASLSNMFYCYTTGSKDKV